MSALAPGWGFGQTMLFIVVLNAILCIFTDEFEHDIGWGICPWNHFANMYIPHNAITDMEIIPKLFKWRGKPQADQQKINRQFEKMKAEAILELVKDHARKAA